MNITISIEPKAGRIRGRFEFESSEIVSRKFNLNRGFEISEYRLNDIDFEISENVEDITHP
ncbi:MULTISPECIES: hypothetical protein [unclassified Fusibacter]|uniref:hypothetical protein n=1 Tax=unclassified Fusibacter TaxID=2624464 RepID=UPI0010113339|nr:MULTISPECIES: hypothetical protein [unclassified Fusibacter]MCK8061148.1 hypothetical protein [Fusibacter sp. A2]NPE23316.1 hypothetical protein [Fusibacter sp. A1]RXV59358.1 hypothetical protein DWB64_15965 [Fusibacter sp. A1]